MRCEKFQEVLAVKGAVNGAGKREAAWVKRGILFVLKTGGTGAYPVNCFVSCPEWSRREGRAEAQSGEPVAGGEGGPCQSCNRGAGREQGHLPPMWVHACDAGMV